MDGQSPRQVTPADVAKLGGWATAWTRERRIPAGFAGGGTWTRGGPFAPAAGPQAGEGESAGTEHTEQAERAQARADLQAAAQIEAQVRALRAELRQLRGGAASASAAGATTGSGNVSSQLASQQASTAAGQRQSQASFSQWLRQQRAQENTIEQQIRQLEDRARDLRHQAAQLFRESKAASDAEVAKARRRKLRRMPVNTDRFRQVPLTGETTWETTRRHDDGRVSKEETPMTWAEVYGKARAVAEGHQATPGGEWGLRLNYQPPGPAHQATIATVHGAGPIASSIAMHQGVAHVDHYDAAGHASPDLRGQLAHRAPGAVPVQSPPHAAPTGHGATFGTTPARDGHGTHLDWSGMPGGNRAMPAGQGRVPDVRPPGCDWSLRAPGDR